MDVFHEKRRAGKTIVLVTHDMATVQALCHRAMLIHDGELRYIGDPEEAALRYYRLNFGGADATPAADERARGPGRARRGWSTPGSRTRPATRVDNVEQGQPIRLNVVIEAREELAEPVFAFHVLNADGATVFGFNTTLARRGRRRGPHRAPAGGSGSAGTIENPLRARALLRRTAASTGSGTQRACASR